MARKQQARSDRKTATPTRILVVEDSATQAERMRLLLEGQGYAVEVARDGRQGLEAVHARPPDLIISDVMMPEMDGYELCRAVNSQEGTRSIPFVLLTERRSPADIVTGLAAGADNFITKPFEDEHLLERVGRIIENLRARRRTGFAMEVRLQVGGRQLTVNADKQQIIELLLSTFEDLGRTNARLQESQRLVEDHARNLEVKVEERTAQLREAELKYRTLVERIPAVAYIAAPAEERSLLYLSPQVEALLGERPEDLYGTPGLWTDRIQEEDRERVRSEIAKAYLTGEPFRSEYRLARADHRPVWVQDEAVVLSDDDGRPQFIQGVIFETTERRLREAELAAKNAELETFLFITSHDLREPLRNIASFAKLLQDRSAAELGQSGQDYLHRIVRSVRRLDRLLDDLILLSQVQRMPPPTEWVAAADVVTDALRMLEDRIQETGARIRVSSSLPIIKAERAWAAHAVHQLVANALTFTRDGQVPEVEIDPYQSPMEGSETIGLIVRDRGPGVEAGLENRIFQLFQRGVGRGIDGTGAGLALVRQIALKHRGNAWVQAREGGGSDFVITFKGRIPTRMRTEAICGT